MRRHALLPLVTYPDPNSPEVAENVVAMAALLGVDLHALALNVDIPPVSNALSRILLDTPELIRQAMALSHKRGEELLAAVRGQASTLGVAVTTGAVSALPALLGDAAATQARYFDLALVGWEAGNQASLMTAEAVIFGSGRPTILVPGGARPGSIDDVAIAWDGSRVAARAVADATALMRTAARISVLTVIDEKPLDENAGERLADSLRRHGLNAQAVPVRSDHGEISATLQAHALELGAGLLVMGGYGHSRIRDFVLGGATRGMLSDLRLPVLLSH